MQVILTEHKQQIRNYINAIPHKSVKHLYKFVYLLNNVNLPKKMPQLALVYIPKDLFILKTPLLYNPSYKHTDIKDLEYLSPRLNLALNNKYSTNIHNLLSFLLSYTDKLILAVDNTLQGEFLGRYFLKKYKLTRFLYGYIEPIAQSSFALQESLKHIYPPQHHINRATVYYYKMLINQLYKVNLTRSITTTLHKQQFKDIFYVVLVQYLLLKTLNKNININKVQNNDKWRLIYKSNKGQNFLSNKYLIGKKSEVKQHIMHLQGQSLLVSQRPSHRFVIIQPHRLFNTVDAIEYVTHHLKVSAQQVIKKGLLPLYWKYHCISYPFTDNHLISLYAFQNLETNLNDYKNLLQKIQKKQYKTQLFSYSKPRSRFVYKSKKYQSNFLHSAIIPIRPLSVTDYTNLPMIARQTYKGIIIQMMLMFIKSSTTITEKVKASLKNIKFVTKLKKQQKSGWINFVGLKVHNDDLSQASKLKSGSQINGRFGLQKINSKPLSVVKMLRLMERLKLLLPSQRIPYIKFMIKHHILSVANNNVSLLSDGKAILELISHTLNNQSNVASNLKYQQLRIRLHNLLANPYKSARNNGYKILQGAITDIKKIVPEIINTDYQLKVHPRIPKIHIRSSKNINVQCPKCHKGYLTLQHYNYKTKYAKAHTRYFCPHCHITFPTSIYHFSIFPSLLPFIFNNMFAPATFRINNHNVKGVLIYKDSQIVFKNHH